MTKIHCLAGQQVHRGSAGRSKECQGGRQGSSRQGGRCCQEGHRPEMSREQIADIFLVSEFFAICNCVGEQAQCEKILRGVEWIVPVMHPAGQMDIYASPSLGDAIGQQCRFSVRSTGILLHAATGLCEQSRSYTGSNTGTLCRFMEAIYLCTADSAAITVTMSKELRAVSAVPYVTCN